LEAIQSGGITATNVPVATVSRRRWLFAAIATVTVAAAAWFAVDRFRRPASVAPSGPRLSDSSRPSQNSEANEYYERSLMFGATGPRQDIAQERRMLERALELDSKFAAARARYAFTHVLMVLRGDSNDQTWLYKGEEES